MKNAQIFHRKQDKTGRKASNPHTGWTWTTCFAFFALKNILIDSGNSSWFKISVDSLIFFSSMCQTVTKWLVTKTAAHMRRPGCWSWTGQRVQTGSTAFPPHFTATHFGFAVLFRPQRSYSLIKMSCWLASPCSGAHAGEWRGQWGAGGTGSGPATPPNKWLTAA